MKKLLFLIIFLIGTIAQGQNTIYLVFQPADLGLGARVDHQFNGSRLGLYSSLSWGNYKIVPDDYIKNHVKASAGGILYGTETSFILAPWSFVSCGLNYHTYGARKLSGQMINGKIIFDNSIFDPLSFELGAGTRLDRVTLALCVDMIKWDVGINFGYILKYKNHGTEETKKY